MTDRRPERSFPGRADPTRRGMRRIKTVLQALTAGLVLGAAYLGCIGLLLHPVLQAT